MNTLLARMSPEKRVLFLAIVALRKKIGPLKINIVKSIRELRGK